MPVIRLIILFSLAFAYTPVLASDSPVKLVVMITVDQLRGDVPWKYQDKFAEGGFRYFLEKGTLYDNAHYRHATTYTAVGHATLATGGSALQHGMAANDWIDHDTGQRVYCVEDKRYKVLGRDTRPHEGTSPANLTASTFGDELIKTSGGTSRVFSVSVKDRGAILPGGHRGKSFWYDSRSGRFISSSYYYDTYPTWVEKWNGEKKAETYQDSSWGLLHPRENYNFADEDDRPFENSFKKLGRTFPHPLANEDQAAYYSSLRFTPFGDDLVLDFAQSLLKHEQLGKKDATDMLAVSFSSTDYIGHAFGPNSLESEDNLYRLDRVLVRLLAYIDAHVGLDKSLIILSSDHGVDAAPEYHRQQGKEDSERIDIPQIIAKINGALKKQFSINDDLLMAFWNPAFFLDVKKIRELGLKIEDVESSVAAMVKTMPGFSAALTRTELLRGNLPGQTLIDKVKRSFHPTRSGNVIVVQEKFWFLDREPYFLTATHGSPHDYDTHVPIFLSGPGIPAQTFHRRVSPESLAATVSDYLDVARPAGASDNILYEVLGQRQPD